MLLVDLLLKDYQDVGNWIIDKVKKAIHALKVIWNKIITFVTKTFPAWVKRVWNNILIFLHIRQKPVTADKNKIESGVKKEDQAKLNQDIKKANKITMQNATQDKNALKEKPSMNNSTEKAASNNDSGSEEKESIQDVVADIEEIADNTTTPEAKQEVEKIANAVKQRKYVVIGKSPEMQQIVHGTFVDIEEARKYLMAIRRSFNAYCDEKSVFMPLKRTLSGIKTKGKAAVDRYVEQNRKNYPDEKDFGTAVLNYFNTSFDDFDSDDAEHFLEYFLDQVHADKDKAYKTIEGDYNIVEIHKIAEVFPKNKYPETTSKVLGVSFDDIIKLLEDPDIQKFLNYKKEIYTKIFSRLNSFTAAFQRTLNAYHDYSAFFIGLYSRLLESQGTIKKNEKDNSYVMVK